MWKNDLTRLLKITYPIIQAPMAGGSTSTELVAAVSNAGGLGMIGAGYMSPIQIRQQIQEVKNETNKSFGINLFVPSKYSVDNYKLQTAKKLLQSLENKLRVDDEAILPNYETDQETFHQQVNILIEEKVPICSFTFGLPSHDIVEKLKKNEIIVIGTATTVEEAIMNARAGMDAVVVQGAEAGGHRGTFLSDSKQSLIGLISLIPQAADQIGIPIIAAGGIMDGRGLIAAKCLGALGVQMGSAFLVCNESGANNSHKEAIINTIEEDVVLTKSFSGKMARGINNDFIEAMKAYQDELPEYPLQNALTKGIRKASEKMGNPEYMSLWAGQSTRLAKKQTVQELFNNIIQEAVRIKNTL